MDGEGKALEEVFMFSSNHPLQSENFRKKNLPFNTKRDLVL